MRHDPLYNAAGVQTFDKFHDAAITSDEIVEGHGSLWEAQRKIRRTIRADAVNPQNISPESLGKIWTVPVLLSVGASVSSDTNDWHTTEYRLPDTGQPITRLIVGSALGVYVLCNFDGRNTQIRNGTTWYPQALISVPSGSAPQEIRLPRAHYSPTVSVWNNAAAVANAVYPAILTLVDDGPDYDGERR